MSTHKVGIATDITFSNTIFSIWTICFKMARKKPLVKDASASDASSSDVDPQLDKPAKIVESTKTSA
jgi:hypothetical protein